MLRRSTNYDFSGGFCRVKYFKDDEFKCKCGCGFDITDELKRKLNIMRESAGVPFVITSGARCVKHNAAVGGKADSAHTRGLAVDIKYQSSHAAYAMEKVFYANGIKRIGRNHAKKFIHIDIDEALPQNVSFQY